eukprot:3657360-Prymnesium_polylepis.1
MCARRLRAVEFCRTSSTLGKRSVNPLCSTSGRLSTTLGHSGAVAWFRRTAGDASNLSRESCGWCSSETRAAVPEPGAACSSASQSKRRGVVRRRRSCSARRPYPRPSSEPACAAFGSRTD